MVGESDRRSTGLPRLRSAVADYAASACISGVNCATKIVFFQYSKYTYFGGRCGVSWHRVQQLYVMFSYGSLHMAMRVHSIIRTKTVSLKRAGTMPGHLDRITEQCTIPWTPGQPSGQWNRYVIGPASHQVHRERLPYRNIVQSEQHNILQEWCIIWISSRCDNGSVQLLQRWQKTPKDGKRQFLLKLCWCYIVENKSLHTVSVVIIHMQLYYYVIRITK